MMNIIEEVNWLFGVTVSASNKSDPKNTFLQLNFKSKDDKDINVELDLKQFNDLLHELETIKLKINK